MYFYIFLGALIELPLYYFALSAKDRRPELVLFILVLNLITWPISLSVGSIFPNPYIAILMVVLSGIAEGFVLKMMYAKSMSLKRSLIMGVAINAGAFIFLRLLIAVFAR